MCCNFFTHKVRVISRTARFNTSTSAAALFPLRVKHPFIKNVPLLRVEQLLPGYKPRGEGPFRNLKIKARPHRLCIRGGMLESFLICPGELTDDQVMELLKLSFRQQEVVLALAKMIHDLQEARNVPTLL